MCQKRGTTRTRPYQKKNKGSPQIIYQSLTLQLETFSNDCLKNTKPLHISKRTDHKILRAIIIPWLVDKIQLMPLLRIIARNYKRESILNARLINCCHGKIKGKSFFLLILDNKDVILLGFQNEKLSLLLRNFSETR